MMITKEQAERMTTNDLLELLKEAIEEVTTLLEHPGYDSTKNECWEIYQRLNTPVRILRDEAHKRIKAGHI